MRVYAPGGCGAPDPSPDRDRLRKSQPELRPKATAAGPSAPQQKHQHRPHQSHFFFRSYEANLPTSLNDVLFLTRGFLPRRPAAVMGTAFRPVICHLALVRAAQTPCGIRGRGEKKSVGASRAVCAQQVGGGAAARRPRLSPTLPSGTSCFAAQSLSAGDVSRIEPHSKSTELTRQENSCREHTRRSQFRRCHHNHILPPKARLRGGASAPPRFLKKPETAGILTSVPFDGLGPKKIREPAFTTSLHPSLRTESPAARCSCCGTLLHFSPVGFKSARGGRAETPPEPPAQTEILQ